MSDSTCWNLGINATDFHGRGKALRGHLPNLRLGTFLFRPFLGDAAYLSPGTKKGLF